MFPVSAPHIKQKMGSHSVNPRDNKLLFKKKLKTKNTFQGGNSPAQKQKNTQVSLADANGVPPAFHQPGSRNTGSEVCV